MDNFPRSAVGAVIGIMTFIGLISWALIEVRASKLFVTEKTYRLERESGEQKYKEDRIETAKDITNIGAKVDQLETAFHETNSLILAQTGDLRLLKQDLDNKFEWLEKSYKAQEDLCDKLSKLIELLK